MNHLGKEEIIAGPFCSEGGTGGAGGVSLAVEGSDPRQVLLDLEAGSVHGADYPTREREIASALEGDET
jgi:hypothetical protein